MALLEVCVDDAAGLAAAVEGGADRIELCAALGVGGLTPSPGLMALAASAPCPVRAMIRPRAGDFVYSGAEVDSMLRDMDAVRAAGLSGLVLGASLGDGALDEKILARLVAHAGGLEITLHRAMDLTPDLFVALEAAIALGFASILTSGGKRTAPEGADIIKALVRKAGSRIEILAGSGLHSGNVAGFLRQTGVRAVHGSCSAAIPLENPRVVELGFSPAGARRTDADTVRRMKAASGEGIQ